jgi:hypothetical protein
MAEKVRQFIHELMHKAAGDPNAAVASTTEEMARAPVAETKTFGPRDADAGSHEAVVTTIEETLQRTQEEEDTKYSTAEICRLLGTSPDVLTVLAAKDGDTLSKILARDGNVHISADEIVTSIDVGELCNVDNGHISLKQAMDTIDYAVSVGYTKSAIEVVDANYDNFAVVEHAVQEIKDTNLFEVVMTTYEQRLFELGPDDPSNVDIVNGVRSRASAKMTELGVTYDSDPLAFRTSLLDIAIDIAENAKKINIAAAFKKEKESVLLEGVFAGSPEITGQQVAVEAPDTQEIFQASDDIVLANTEALQGGAFADTAAIRTVPDTLIAENPSQQLINKRAS